MKISFVCHDLSDNCLGRAYILAKVLQRNYDVEIVGPASKGAVWTPLQDDTTIKYRFFKPWRLRNNMSMIDGDVVYAVKPRGASFGYALLQKYIGRHKAPIILDIDDWEYGFFLDASVLGKLWSMSHIWDLNSLSYTMLLEPASKKAAAITTSNTFLQNRFGGTLIPHFRDTDVFDPRKFDPLAIKQELGIAGKKVVLFLGTPRRHKGIMQLIEAMDSLQRDDAILLIVGASPEDAAQFPKRSWMKVLGRQPFETIPRFLAAADVVALFQTASRSAQGQLPAKVFDAMAMEKAIIASRVSDLPLVLEGCGEVVTPGDISELSSKITQLLDDPAYAAELGRKARQKCVEHYSYEAMAPQLRAVVEAVTARQAQ